jgi:hypothetical protein
MLALIICGAVLSGSAWSMRDTPKQEAAVPV